MRKILVFFIFALVFNSCIFQINKTELLNDEERGVLDTNFRIDGYYYSTFIDSHSCQTYFSQDINLITIHPLIFHRDGTLTGYGKVSSIALTDKSCYEANNTVEGCHENFINNVISMNGVHYIYAIKQGTMRLQKFVNKSGGAFPIPIIVEHLYEYRGTIINDSTFKILYRFDYSNIEDKKMINTIYKFREFKDSRLNKIQP